MESKWKGRYAMQFDATKIQINFTPEEKKIIEQFELQIIHEFCYQYNQMYGSKDSTCNHCIFNSLCKATGCGHVSAYKKAMEDTINNFDPEEE